MSISEHIATGWFDSFFEWQIQALAGIAFGMLVLAGQISLLPFLIFSLAYGSAVLLKTHRLQQLTARQVNVASWFYLPVFFLDIFVWSHSFIPATLHLILVILLLKIYQQKEDRDYYQIILLSFLLVLAASSLTINFSFLAGFLTFLLCCLATLISFEIKRARVNALSPVERDKTGTLVSAKPLKFTIGPQRQKRLTMAIFVLSTCALAAIALGGTLFFFGLPRLGSGYFSRVQNRYSTLTGFNDRIQLGGIGKIQLDSSVVMRVQFANPFKGAENVKWRGVALDYFDGRNWSKQTAGKRRYFPVTRNFHLQNPEGIGERLSYQVLMEPSGTMFIFTLDQILDLEGRLSPLSFDPLDDSIHARVHPNQRMAYRAESYLRQNRNQTSAPPPLIDFKPYLQLPILDSRISQLARRIVKADDSPERKTDQVEKYLQKNYSYSLEPSAIHSPQPLASFLFQNKSGHCEYFATAMVVLLRILQVPCRIVNGFQGGEYNEVGEDYIVRGSNAHSWVEVFLADKGWTPYDPTPASTSYLERNFLSKAFSNYWDAIELFWGQWILPYDDVLQASLFSDFQQLSVRWTSESRKVLQSREKWLEHWGESLPRWFESWFIRHRLVLLLTLPGILLGAWLLLKVAPAIRWHWMRSHPAGKTASSQATQLYLEMLRLLRKKGMVKSPSQTPMEFAHSIGGQDVADKVFFLTRHYNQSRFSAIPPDELERDTAWKILQSLLPKR